MLIGFKLQFIQIKAKNINKTRQMHTLQNSYYNVSPWHQTNFFMHML